MVLLSQTHRSVRILLGTEDIPTSKEVNSAEVLNQGVHHLNVLNQRVQMF